MAITDGCEGDAARFGLVEPWSRWTAGMCHVGNEPRVAIQGPISENEDRRPRLAPGMAREPASGNCHMSRQGEYLEAIEPDRIRPFVGMVDVRCLLHISLIGVVAVAKKRTAAQIEPGKQEMMGMRG